MIERRLRVLKFLTASGVVAVTWLIFLPWFARQPAERTSWEALQRGRIDPSAMYYTELEAMEPILQRLNAQQSRDPYHRR